MLRLDEVDVPLFAVVLLFTVLCVPRDVVVVPWRKLPLLVVVVPRFVFTVAPPRYWLLLFTPVDTVPPLVGRVTVVVP